MDGSSAGALCETRLASTWKSSARPAAGRIPPFLRDEDERVRSSRDLTRSDDRYAIEAAALYVTRLFQPADLRRQPPIVRARE